MLHLPTWLFVLLLTAFTVTLVLGGLALKFKFLPHLFLSSEDNQSANILIRLTSTLLTVMLAFMVISIWKDYEMQRTNTEEEACTLGNLYRDARGANLKVEAEIQGLVVNYTRAVVEHSWPAMADGRESKRAWRAFNDLYGYVIRINPENKKEEIIFARLSGHLNKLATYRRLRNLRNQNPSMPEFMSGIIFLGCIVNIVFSYLLQVENKRMHQLMVGMGGIMLGLVFSLIMLLNHPYRSSVKVSSQPLENLLDDVFPMAEVSLVEGPKPAFQAETTN
ncbi:MAG TPA: hypothetical protein VK927_06630 [Adhaeribacter sp.]|nr:hypothetical protein [Adhaeribacter sp.]